MAYDADDDDPNDPSHPDHDLSEAMPYRAARPARRLYLPRIVFLVIGVLLIVSLLLPMLSIVF